MKYLNLAIVAFFSAILVMGICGPIAVNGFSSGRHSVTIRSYGQIVYSNLQPTDPTSQWLKTLELLFVSPIVSILIFVLSNLILDYLRGQRQKLKDGKFKTPVVIYQ